MQVVGLMLSFMRSIISFYTARAFLYSCSADLHSKFCFLVVISNVFHTTTVKADTKPHLLPLDLLAERTQVLLAKKDTTNELIIRGKLINKFHSSFLLCD